MNSSHHIRLIQKDDIVLLAITTLLCLITGYYIMINDPLRRLGETTVVGELTTDSSIRRRRAGWLVWENLSDRSSLYLKDTLVSPPDGGGVITLNNGTIIALEPNSMLQLKEVLKHNFEATVFYGTVKKKESSKDGQRVALAVQQREQRMESIKRVTMRPLIVTLVEELPVLTPLILEQKNHLEKVLSVINQRAPRGTLRTMSSLEQPVVLDGLKYFKLDFNLPAGTRNFVVKKLAWFELNWPQIPLPGIKYSVVFSEKENFERPIVYKVKNNRLPLQLTTSGKYYVKVRATYKRKRIHSPLIQIRVAE